MNATAKVIEAARRAVEAWDETVLPVSRDGMMQDRMERLRDAVQALREEPAPKHASETQFDVAVGQYVSAAWHHDTAGMRVGYVVLRDLFAAQALREPVQPEPVAWMFGASFWGKYESIPSSLLAEAVPLYATPPAPAQAVGEEPVARWLPIETAPEDTGGLAVVLWTDKDGEVHHDLDFREDGCWMLWHDHAEHVEVIGGHGVSHKAPYTHWLPLPQFNGASSAQKAPPLNHPNFTPTLNKGSGYVGQRERAPDDPPALEPECKGSPGECAYQGACMYQCGRASPPHAAPAIDTLQNQMRPAYCMNYAAYETPAEQVLRKLACWLGVG